MHCCELGREERLQLQCGRAQVPEGLDAEALGPLSRHGTWFMELFSYLFPFYRFLTDNIYGLITTDLSPYCFSKLFVEPFLALLGGVLSAKDLSGLATQTLKI